MSDDHVPGAEMTALFGTRLVASPTRNCAGLVRQSPAAPCATVAPIDTRSIDSDTPLPSPARSSCRCRTAARSPRARASARTNPRCIREDSYTTSRRPSSPRVAVLVRAPEPQPRPAVALVVARPCRHRLVVLLQPNRAFTSGSAPVIRSLFGMNRISVLISNDSVVRIFAISSVRLRFARNSRVSRAMTSNTLSLAPSRRRRDVAGDLGQADLARDLADALLGREHRAHAGRERLLDQLGDEVLEALADRLGQLVLARPAPAAVGTVPWRMRSVSFSLMSLSGCVRLGGRAPPRPASGGGARRRWPYPWVPPIRAVINPLEFVVDGGPARRRRGRLGQRARCTSRAATATSTQSQRRRRCAIRSLRAYWTTFRVIWSYLWLRFRARFHSRRVDRAQRCATIHLRNARRIERTICELQGLFIKVGQLISIMTNFLPEEFRRELEGLQDAVPPRPYADIEARLREELGKPPDELFAQFERAADRVGVDRPGPPRAAARRQQGRGQGPVPRHRGDRAPRSPHAAPHLPHRRVVRPVPGPRGAVSRDPRDRDGGARLPRRGRQRARASPANFEGRTDVGVPAASSTSCRRRACSSRTSRPACKITDKRGVEAARPRSRPARAPGRRDLLPADLHRRRLSRRSAPREPARAAGAERRRPPTIVFLDFGAVAEIPAQRARRHRRADPGRADARHAHASSAR